MNKKSHLLSTTQLAKWCHWFQCFNCACFKPPLGITRRQYWINEIGWKLKLAYLVSGQWAPKTPRPDDEPLRNTHRRRWRLPKTRPVQACS